MVVILCNNIIMLVTRKCLRNIKTVLAVASLLLFIQFNYLHRGKEDASIRDENNELQRLRDHMDDELVDTSNYLNEYKWYTSKQRAFYVKHPHRSDANKYKILIENDRSIRSLNKPSYQIVEYTTFWGETKFCHLDIDIYLDECPYKNCRFSCDKSQIYQADALMFHESDMPRVTVENMVFLKRTLSRHRNRAEQVWILWNDEAWRVSKSLNLLRFNWTMSYRSDAEVSDCAYGCTYATKKTEQNATGYLSWIESEHKRRLGRAVWFVSNCGANFRMQIATQLAKHYPIKVLGSCHRKVKFIKNNRPFYSYFIYLALDYLSIMTGGWLDFVSEKRDNTDMLLNKRIDCKVGSVCELNEFNSHRYYLSFESKNCSNYITEKLWRTLRTFMIPIVIQPSKEFYELVAPRNSFIHMQDFDYDYKRLAEHLRRLDRDPQAYAEYHKWRLSHDVVHTGLQAERRRLCELCTKLNTETSRIYYNQVAEWMNHDCIIN